MSFLLDILIWTVSFAVLLMVIAFFISWANYNASVEARSNRELLMKILNLSVLPLGVLLFSALFTADFRRVYYPPGTPKWIAIWPAFQVTAFITVHHYLLPLMLYLWCIGMLFWKLRRTNGRVQHGGNETSQQS
ncbi:MAG: hypothetical protein KatS3mg023_1952 [Armatimonadota bacterium]|nr:MAG: hypothetical protein KatS3mg023_1952 [Armatimonadota bacterium]